MILVEDMKQGRRKIGSIYKSSDDALVLVVSLSNKYIRTNKEKTVSDAIRNKTAEIGVKYEVLLKAKAKNVKFVAFIIKETKDIYLMHFEKFFTDSVYRYGYKYLPICNFACATGKMKI